MINRETLGHQLDIALKRTPAQLQAKQGTTGIVTKQSDSPAPNTNGKSASTSNGAPVAAAPTLSASERSAELLAQRERLIERFAVMQSDLGGAFYEMAVRDHVRVDVLTARAAELQAVDSELAQVERRIELQRTGAVGVCSRCEAPHGPGAAFCSQCGNALAITNGNV